MRPPRRGRHRRRSSRRHAGAARPTTRWRPACVPRPSPRRWVSSAPTRRGRVELLLRRGCRSTTSTPTCERIRAVTAEAADAAYRRSCSPRRSTFVVVGDAADGRATACATGAMPTSERQQPADARLTSSGSAGGSAEGGVDDVLGLGLHLAEVIGAAERLGIDLVDVLGARRPRREPRRLGASP